MPAESKNKMPEITFPTDWVKINENTLEGDIIQFLDVGTLDPDTERHVFNVAIFRKGEIVEASKKFNLNKTNFKEVAKLYGTNSDAWINKEMSVSKIKVRNPQTGGLVDSIALSAPVATTPLHTQTPAAPEAPAA